MPRTVFTRSAHDPAVPTIRPAPPSAAADAEGTTGTLLFQVVLATGATQVVECGSATGSLMVPVAAALRDNGRGRVVGCQPDADRAASVSSRLEQAGLAAYGEVLEGNPQDVLLRAPGPIDLLVVGGPEECFLPVLRAMEPRLLPGAVVVACGVEDAVEQSGGFLAHVRSPGSSYVSLPLSLDGGLELAVRAD